MTPISKISEARKTVIVNIQSNFANFCLAVSDISIWTSCARSAASDRSDIADTAYYHLCHDLLPFAVITGSGIYIVSEC